MHGDWVGGRPPGALDCASRGLGANRPARSAVRDRETTFPGGESTAVAGVDLGRVSPAIPPRGVGSRFRGGGDRRSVGRDQLSRGGRLSASAPRVVRLRRTALALGGGTVHVAHGELGTRRGDWVARGV